jgi:predicted nucleic acid-binding protein
LTEAEITGLVAFLASAAETVDVDETIVPPIRDPKDIPIVQTAISGKAGYLCTLDAHFYETSVVTFCSKHGVTVLSDLDLLRLVRGG